MNKGAKTRTHVLTVATRLFGERGYDATSTEAILNACEISRGAFYHHFESKDGLFEAVLDAIEAHLATVLVAASVSFAGDERAMLEAGANAFLLAVQDRAIRQIVLIDAPAVLGWSRWREVDSRHGLGLIKAIVNAAAARGRVRPELAETYAHVLLAGVLEIALLISRAPDPEIALRDGRLAVRELVEGLIK